MLIDELLTVLINYNKNNTLWFKHLTTPLYDHAPVGGSGPVLFFSDFKDSLAELAGQISDNLSRIKYRRTLDAHTYFKDLNREEVVKFDNTLKERFESKNKSFDDYRKRFTSKTAIYQINSIISAAFYLQLSFGEFRALAHLAGYSFERNTPYPPYYFLREMLNRECFDYCQYKKALAGKSFIKEILRETDILKLNFFHENDIKAFFQSNSGKYKMTFQEALKNLDFQTDFLSYFLESVYITGSLTENRSIDKN